MTVLNLSQELEALEAVCDDKTALVQYHLPQLQHIVDTIVLLPKDQQEEYMGRLERISMILEGQLMALGEELESLRQQIPASINNNAGSRAYNRVAAVIKMPANDSGTKEE